MPEQVNDLTGVVVFGFGEHSSHLIIYLERLQSANKVDLNALMKN